MENRILKNLYETRKGMYCHALEVSCVDELEDVIATIANETSKFYVNEEEHKKELIEFFQTMEIYYYAGDEENKEDEEAIYNLNIKNFVNEFYSSFNCYNYKEV
jgi:hypothetical protein